MKTLISPDSLVLRISGSVNSDDPSKIRMSQFSAPFVINDQKIIYNTLTKECLLLNDNEYQTVTDTQLTYDPENHFHQFLADHRFLTSSADECNVYCSVISLMRTLSASGKISTYTILPTTFCNARCFYCYEQNYKFITMSNETINHVIQFIRNTHADHEIKIRWFGGEPLLGRKIIDRISDELTLSGIPFRSEMITNGSLFSEELIRTAKNKWNLRKVQITLDGTEDEYNQRKNYFISNPSPFRTVIHNIHLLQDAEIKVTVRLNADMSNFDNLLQLKNDLCCEFSNKDHLAVYCHPLFEEMNSDKCTEIFNACTELEKQFYESGFSIPSLGTKGKLKPYYCIAADPACITVDPNGHLYGCEHCDGSNHSEICTADHLPSRKRAIQKSDIQEKCRTCHYLPLCTEFKDCPDIIDSCMIIKEQSLKKSISVFLEKNPITPLPKK